MSSTVSRVCALRSGHNLGRRAETIAGEYLFNSGWAILARNYRAGPREIDIIAERGGLIAFIEVKARTRGEAIYAVTGPKRRHLNQAAARWINENPNPASEYRFDAITVCFKRGKAVVEHFENAWRT